MKRVMVYANDVLVDNIIVKDTYTEDDYINDCASNGWEFAPCNEGDYIEFVECDDSL